MTAPLAISMGDPAGIGPEIIAKAWAVRRKARLAPFFAVGDARAIGRVWTGPIATIDSPDAATAAFAKALPVLSIEDAGAITPGLPDADGARCALHALELATGLARNGAAGALVTGPVSKAQLYNIGFTHPGQTEFVAERVGVAGENAVMMLAGPSLRVVPITTHVALADVPGLLNIDLITAKARATARGLERNFGIANPRLAFAGFNPHAGEQGAIGREEIDILIPAIEQLRSEGIDATGPFASDARLRQRDVGTQQADAVGPAGHVHRLRPRRHLSHERFAGDDGADLSRRRRFPRPLHRRSRGRREMAVYRQLP